MKLNPNFEAEYKEAKEKYITAMSESRKKIDEITNTVLQLTAEKNKQIQQQEQVESELLFVDTFYGDMVPLYNQVNLMYDKAFEEAQESFTHNKQLSSIWKEV